MWDIIVSAWIGVVVGIVCFGLGLALGAAVVEVIATIAEVLQRLSVREIADRRERE